MTKALVHAEVLNLETAPMLCVYGRMEKNKSQNASYVDKVTHLLSCHPLYAQLTPSPPLNLTNMY